MTLEADLPHLGPANETRMIADTAAQLQRRFKMAPEDAAVIAEAEVRAALLGLNPKRGRLAGVAAVLSLERKYRSRGVHPPSPQTNLSAP